MTAPTPSSTATPPPAKLDLAAPPQALLRGWPRSRRLAALWSGSGEAPLPDSANTSARWTFFAEPLRTLTDGWPALFETPLDRLSTATPTTSQPARPADAPPLDSGWIGWLSYDLGGKLEPKAALQSDSSAASPPPSSTTTASAAPPTPPWPLMQWHFCPALLAYDNFTGHWWATGPAQSRDPLIAAARSAAANTSESSFTLGHLASNTGPDHYQSMVRRALEHIGAGDVYQVNLTHRLRAPFTGSSRAFFAALVRRARPWYGAYLESPEIELDPQSGGLIRRAVCSASPELFLHVDGSGRITTRPMKGTRRGDANPAELDSSNKERAELTMITDLLRNDLGRICRAGSVHVDDPRRIERHGGEPAEILQATATITGQLLPGVSVESLLRATFPGGSVTGAPKISAMRIIAASEPAARGPYCGAIGLVGTGGWLSLNIAIRTALISQREPTGSNADEFTAATLEYPVGAGIVADSDPAAEWQETLDKAGVILPLSGATS